MKGIIIYEKILECPDCKEGSPTHNSFHLPYSEMNYAINPPHVSSLWKIMEEYTAEEVNSAIQSLYKEGKGMRDIKTGKLEKYSWTQFAIQRCNFHR